MRNNTISYNKSKHTTYITKIVIPRGEQIYSNRLTSTLTGLSLEQISGFLVLIGNPRWPPSQNLVYHKTLREDE
jgi:hypothetical protein